MKYIGTISLSWLLALAANAAPPAGDTIRITQLGLQPGSRINATPFVNEAVKRCREKPGSVLYFPEGRYDFWPSMPSNAITTSRTPRTSTPNALRCFSKESTE